MVTPGLFHLTHALAVSQLLAETHPDGPDGRILDAIGLRVANPIELLLWLYPRMFAVDTERGPLPLVSDSFGCGNVFLFHLMEKVIVWVSAQTDGCYLQATFGVGRVEDLPGDLPVLEGKENQSLREKYEKCCELSGKYLPLMLIGQGDPREVVMGSLLVDSQPANPLAALDVWIREMQHV
jgi:hypothetical protein